MSRQEVEGAGDSKGDGWELRPGNTEGRAKLLIAYADEAHLANEREDRWEAAERDAFEAGAMPVSMVVAIDRCRHEAADQAHRLSTKSHRCMDGSLGLSARAEFIDWLIDQLSGRRGWWCHGRTIRRR